MAGFFWQKSQLENDIDTEFEEIVEDEPKPERKRRKAEPEPEAVTEPEQVVENTNASE